MQLDRDGNVCGHKAAGPAAADARSLPIRISVLRAAMNVPLIVQLRGHHTLQCCGLDSSMFGRDHDESPAASFSHTAYRHEHGLTFS